MHTTQARLSLLLELLKGQRKTADPAVMMQAASQAAGELLRVDQVGFFQVLGGTTVECTVSWSGGRLPHLTGNWPVLSLGSRYLCEVTAGKTVAIADARIDPFIEGSLVLETGTVSLIVVPIVRNGQWHAGLYVNHAEVREWGADEVSLVQDIAEQTWDAVERVCAEESLRKSEERLTFALEAGAGVGTWDWDIPGDRVYASPPFARVFSVDPERAEGGTRLCEFTDSVHPDDRANVCAAIRRATESGGNFAEEYRVIQPDGSVRWVYARGRCHLDSSGKPSRFPGVVLDITDRKQAEAALRQQWHTFDTALSHTPDFTYIFNREGRFTYINSALLRLWQKSLDEAVGKDFWELGYPRELAARLQRQIQEVIETKAPIRDQTPFTGPTGETRHYEYIFVPVFDPDGQVEAVAGSTRDITERLQAESALRESESRFRFLAESIPQLVWTADATGYVTWYNRRWYDYTGSTPEEMEGWGWQKALAAESLPEVLSVWRKVLAEGEPFEMVFPIRGADGQFRPFLTQVKPAKDASGRVLQWFGTNTDITDQRRTEDELRRANRELEEFAYVASHDLQEPLRMVNVYTQMILKSVGGNEPALAQYGAFVKQGVTRMEALIHDLLTYSRIVHADDSPAGIADLSASLAEAKSVLKDRIEESGASIHAQPLPMVRGDAGQIAHVFQNLLSNAIKYRRQDTAPVIAISAERHGDQWVIAVQDNGIGFEQRYAERIFGLFKRLHGGEFPGTGLGLAICQRTVERYGGKIWAQGRPGEGATFYFALHSPEVN